MQVRLKPCLNMFEMTANVFDLCLVLFYDQTRSWSWRIKLNDFENWLLTGKRIKVNRFKNKNSVNQYNIINEKFLDFVKSCLIESLYSLTLAPVPLRLIVKTKIRDTSAGTGKLCILGHLGLVFIWSCFVSCLLFLLFYVAYVICAPVPAERSKIRIFLVSWWLYSQPSINWEWWHWVSKNSWKRLQRTNILLFRYTISTLFIDFGYAQNNKQILKRK